MKYIVGFVFAFTTFGLLRGFASYSNNYNWIFFMGILGGILGSVVWGLFTFKY